MPALFVLLLMLALGGHAYGCICFAAPKCVRTERLAKGESAFVGKVVEIWPTREVLRAEAATGSESTLRRRFMDRWGSILPAEALRHLRTEPYLFEGLQRVRFEVAEHLGGTRTSEIYTGATSCGIAFQRGETYLVVASRNGGLMRTGACSGTGSVLESTVSTAIAELRALETGREVVRKIYGRIAASSLGGDTRLLLWASDGSELAVVPDANGSFSMEGLGKTKYRFRVEDARGSDERLIDLSKRGCFEANISFSDKWRIDGF
jgi:hypothetical protein